MSSAIAPVLLLLAAATGAHADVISPTTVFPPPPRDCPRGSQPVGGSHGGVGPHCDPSVCTRDADCHGARGVCRSLGLCVAMIPGGHVPPYPHAVGACTADTDCSDGNQCIVARRCANVPATPPPPPHR